MSGIDYLCCKKCYKKIFYDEHQDLLDYLETYHESKGLMCPDCSEQLERENAELKALVARMKLALSAQCVNCEWLHENECGDCRTKKLLEAAERG
jgi:hypothetical protein